MLRVIEFPVDQRWIKNPKNSSPNASKGARYGTAAITRLCIATIGLILDEHFTVPTAFYRNDTARACGSGYTVPNLWTVTLTRISMGVVDPVTGGATMAAVQDAIALWCGVKNERDPVWRWVEPIRQEKRGRGFFGVRLEIADLAPGEDRRVALKNIDRHVWTAKQRIKEANMYKQANGGVRKVGRVQTYQPEAGARAASSAARGKAEQAFAKLTAKPGAEVEQDVSRAAGAIFGEPSFRLGKPTALDLRDAAERVLAVRPTNPDRTPHDQAFERVASGKPSRIRLRDPGEERPARDLVDGRHCCGVAICEPCIRGGDHEVFVNGVHYQRAKAAGIQIGDTVKIDVTPWLKKAPTNGSRRIVTPPVMAAWVRLPYEQRACETCRGSGKGRLVGPLLEAQEDRCAFCGCTDDEPCQRADGTVGCSWAAREDAICSRCKWTGVCAVCDGRAMAGPIRRDARHDGDGPERVTYTVPAEHRARFGDTVTLTRRPFTSERTGACWLYE